MINHSFSAENCGVQCLFTDIRRLVGSSAVKNSDVIDSGNGTNEFGFAPVVKICFERMEGGFAVGFPVFFGRIKAHLVKIKSHRLMVETATSPCSKMISTTFWTARAVDPDALSKTGQITSP